MLVEKLEEFQIENIYNKQQVKVVLKKALQVITPLAERDFPVLFKSNESATQATIREYEDLVAQLRNFTFPDKLILGKMLQALNIDKKTIEATVHRVLKKEK